MLKKTSDMKKFYLQTVSCLVALGDKTDPRLFVAMTLYRLPGKSVSTSFLGFSSSKSCARAGEPGLDGSPRYSTRRW